MIQKNSLLFTLGLSALIGCEIGQNSTKMDTAAQGISVLVQLPREAAIVASAEPRRIPSSIWDLFAQVSSQAPATTSLEKFVVQCVGPAVDRTDSLLLAWSASGSDFGLVAVGPLAAAQFQACAKDLGLAVQSAAPDTRTFLLASAGWLPQMLELHDEPAVARSAAANEALATQVRATDTGAPLWWAGTLSAALREQVARALDLEEAGAAQTIRGTVGPTEGLSLSARVELDHPGRAASAVGNLRANLAVMRGGGSDALDGYVDATKVHAEQSALVLDVSLTPEQIRAVSAQGATSADDTHPDRSNDFYCGAATLCAFPPVPILICQNRYCNNAWCTVRSTTYPCGICWGFGKNMWKWIPEDRSCHS